MAENQDQVCEFQEMIGTCDAMLHIFKTDSQGGSLRCSCYGHRSQWHGKGNGSPGHSPKEQPE